MKLTAEQNGILRALAAGDQLKSHRFLDGTKTCCLHGADGAVLRSVSSKDVKRLEKRALIAGNMKFPAAAYLLTAHGAALAASLTSSPESPISVRFPSAD